MAFVVSAPACSEATATDEQADEWSIQAAKPKHGRFITDWVEQAFETVRSENIGTPAAGRLYAMTFAAMFDAVNGIERKRPGSPNTAYTHAIVPPDNAPGVPQLNPARPNEQAAAVAAAHAVLVGLAPGAQVALDAALADSLYEINGPIQNGIDWGEYVGAEVLAARASDGTQTSDIILPASTDPGVFRTSFNQNYANMTPFAISSGAPYELGVAPPALTSSAYATSLNEVFAVGSDQDTDTERGDIALQWNTPGGTVRPTGSAIQAALALAQSEGTDNSLVPTARLFALVGMAVADTLIPVWHDKAEYLTWRPKPAIQRADEDGNGATTHDASFQTRFGSTGGSPEYASGQAAFTSAVATILEEFYDDSGLTWCFSSDANATGRCYNSAREMGDEGGLSRIYQGVHFRFTVEASRAIGDGVALEITTNALQPVP